MAMTIQMGKEQSLCLSGLSLQAGPDDRIRGSARFRLLKRGFFERKIVFNKRLFGIGKRGACIGKDGLLRFGRSDRLDLIGAGKLQPGRIGSRTR